MRGRQRIYTNKNGENSTLQKYVLIRIKQRPWTRCVLLKTRLYQCLLEHDEENNNIYNKNIKESFITRAIRLKMVRALCNNIKFRQCTQSKRDSVNRSLTQVITSTDTDTNPSFESIFLTFVYFNRDGVYPTYSGSVSPCDTSAIPRNYTVARSNLFSYLTLDWSELNYIAMFVCRDHLHASVLSTFKRL